MLIPRSNLPIYFTSDKVEHDKLGPPLCLAPHGHGCGAGGRREPDLRQAVEHGLLAGEVAVVGGGGGVQRGGRGEGRLWGHGGGEPHHAVKGRIVRKTRRTAATAGAAAAATTTTITATATATATANSNSSNNSNSNCCSSSNSNCSSNNNNNNRTATATATTTT